MHNESTKRRNHSAATVHKRSVAMVSIVAVSAALWAGRALGQPEKSLDKCQQTAAKVMAKYAANVQKTVGKCFNAISKERIKNAAGSATGAATKCVSALRKMSNTVDVTKTLSEKAITKLRAACDPSANPDLLHAADDVADAEAFLGGTTVSGDAIRAERLGTACRVSEPTFFPTGEFGRLANPLQWALCQRYIAERTALRNVHVQYPQGDAWLRDVRPAIQAMATLGDVAAQDALLILPYVRRWVDNGGAGTVYDRVTELTWEKKTDDGGIHDKDNTYTWSTGTNDPDGTAFTTFLNTLNGGATGVGNCTSTVNFLGSGGWAGDGHCDWRLPTFQELHTILLAPFQCATNPCIDQTVFGPTQPAFYWSSSTDSLTPVNAWGLFFSDGGPGNVQKLSLGAYARAVRGGS